MYGRSVSLPLLLEGRLCLESSKAMFRSEAWTDLAADSKEKVERGESCDCSGSGTSRVAPAGFGKAFAELVEVDEGRDMVWVELLAECGMLAKREDGRWPF